MCHHWVLFTIKSTLTGTHSYSYNKVNNLPEFTACYFLISFQQPEDNVHDDYLFPMASRLSFAGPRESEQDLSRRHDEFDYSPKHRQRLVRSSSDPSVNTMEKIPGIPPYPAPPSYRKPSSVSVAPYQ